VIGSVPDATIVDADSPVSYGHGHGSRRTAKTDPASG
jgi:hypothetical protein